MSSGAPAAAPFSAAMARLDGELRPALDSSLSDSVADPISRVLATIDVMKSDMRVRENVKIDYDARARVVKEMKEKPGKTDATKLAHKEAKLAATPPIVGCVSTLM